MSPSPPLDALDADGGGRPGARCIKYTCNTGVFYEPLDALDAFDDLMQASNGVGDVSKSLDCQHSETRAETMPDGSRLVRCMTCRRIVRVTTSTELKESSHAPETQSPFPTSPGPGWRCRGPSQRQGLRYDPCPTCQAMLRGSGRGAPAPGPREPHREGGQTV